MVIVAAFDLDGTLTRRDTLVPFLRRLVGPRRLAVGLSAAARNRGGRSERKEALLRATVAGRAAAEVAEAGRRFADEVVDRRLRADTPLLLEGHVDRGHVVVIVTASPELYTSAIGERLGAKAVLGTRLEVDEHGLLTGRYEGANCRGAEKVRRLERWLDGDTPSLLYAYGDSSGDDELLARADVGNRV